MNRRSLGKLAALLSMCGSGCVHYAPLPLDSAAVERALTPLDRAAVRQHINALNNPLIHADDLDPDQPLTPGGVAVLAVVSNPTLRAERDRLSSADAQLLQARILPNPSLSFNLDVPVGSNTKGEVVGYGLGIDWEITALISQNARVQSATAAVEQVRLDVAWKEWQVAQAARRSIYDVVALRAKLADAQRLSEQLDRIAGRAQEALQRHDLKSNDASAASAAADEARVSLASARRDLQDAELALIEAIGLPPVTKLSLDPTLALPDRLAVPDAASLLTNLENRRLDLAALRRGYDSQEATLRAAILNQFPKIALGIANGRDTGDFLTLGPSITADLPFFDRNQGTIAIERATRQQLFDEYCGRIFQARSDVTRAVAMIRSLGDVIQAQQAEVDSLRTLVASDERALAQGNVDVSTFYAAAVSLSQKQNDLTTLKQDLIHAWIDLELATGATLGQRVPATQPGTEVRQ